MATVSVLNTDAGLSGKTLLTAEQPNTITGLETFDRDPNPPFAVTSGSAVVPNLDADKVDGFEASALAKLDTANSGNLIFTDATYDIGASGATRPRDLFLSRNATIGGTLGVTGVVTAAKASNSGVSVLTDGATPALDASLGNTFVLTAAGNRTIAVPSNAVSGQKIVIRHEASGGARTLALNTGAGGFRFGTDITALTATGSGLSDYIGCIYDATDSKWDVVAVVKGY